MASKLNREAEYLNALFTLTLNPVQGARAVDLVASLTPQERAEFLSLADSHHVIVRGLNTILDFATRNGDTRLAQWAAEELERSTNVFRRRWCICRPSAMNWKRRTARPQ